MSKTGNEAERGETPRGVGFPLRGLLVGLALLPLNAYFVFNAEPMRMMWLTNASPFANVIFFLFLVTALNAVVRRAVPRRALSSGDLIAVYVTLSLQTGLGSMNFIHWLMGSISYGHWAATPGNDWAGKYLRHLPDWLVVSDPEALRGYYLGRSNFFTPGPIRAWLLPVVCWTLFFYALAATLTAVAVLFSRQWIHRERLSFPLVELPLAMVSETSGFWRQRRMWAGFALAAGAELVNGLNFLYPSVPQLPLKRVNIGLWFTNPPWNALGETNISFYPFVLGLTFLIPLDLSFSLWFFYLLHKAQLVIGAMQGWMAIPNYPFTYNQQFGAGLAIITIALWSSRAHLARAWRMAWGDKVDAADSEERHEYRRAFIALGIGTAVVTGFLAAAGLPPWMAFVVCALYVVAGLIAARIRCELGFSLHQMPRMNGPHLLVMADGGNDLGLKNLTLLGLTNSFTVNNQSHILPHQFESLKMADRQGIRSGYLTTVMAVAIAVAVPATFLIYLAATYHFGAASAAMQYGRSGRFMYEQFLPLWTGVYAYGDARGLGVLSGSFAFSSFLMFLRARILGFPLHPIGLAVANSNHDITDVVFPVFVASLLKGLILHYGGLRAYAQAVPFFLGLILGDLVMGMGWIAGGFLLETTTYQFFL